MFWYFDTITKTAGGMVVVVVAWTRST